MNLAILLVAAATTAAAQTPQADLVMRGGIVHTAVDGQADARAVAVRGGKIVVVGSDAEVASWIGPQTRLIELQGATVIPGFQEGHGHLMSMGEVRLGVDLMDATSYQQIVQRVAAAAKSRKPGQWIAGHGWHESKWTRKPPVSVRNFPTHAALSAAVPANPVVLDRADGHAVLVNAAAMKLSGITKDTVSPDGGEIIRDAKGEATGVFVDNAMGLIKVPEPDMEQQNKALDLAFEELSRKGITRFHDAGATRATVALLEERAKAGTLPVRFHIMLSGFDAMRAFGEPRIDPDGWLAIRAVKLYADGAMGSRGAVLLEPYDDDPKNSGFFTTPPEAMLEATRYAATHGFQPCTHAIGDKANRTMLDIYEKVLGESPRLAELRPRIEHAQILDEQDIPRFGKLGVIASMEGIHCTSDRPWAESRIGKARVTEGLYVWQKLLKSGARIVNGTDVPVEDVDPIRSYYASVTRMSDKGLPPGGFDPDQKMTRREALLSYTREAAYGAFEEKNEGTIEVDKRADFTVLSKDILAVPDKDILHAAVLYTIVGGVVRYQQPAARK
jgi:predicted amidohydrolase YtcJ